MDLLTVIFDAKTLRRFDHENGKIAYIELQLDDSVIIISDSSETYPANTTMLHLYVPDDFKTFDKSFTNGCEIIERLIQKERDADTRGSFNDFAGNFWSVSTQTK